MGAKTAGQAFWVIEDNLEKSSGKETRYKAILTELAKYIGEASNSGDIDAYKFLLHYTQLIFQCGFEVLKETLGEVEKSKDFETFTKKMGILDN